MKKQDLQTYLEFAKGLAAEAGIIMRRYFRAKDIGTEWKEDSTPLTVADTAINEMVIERIKTAYPQHGVIGEEVSYEPAREWVWVVDPIDGTIPFSLGIPVSTFCLALVHKGDVLVSVVFEPFQDRLFSAICGAGSFMNDQRLAVSGAKDFSRSYVFVSSWNKRDKRDMRIVESGLQERGARAFNLFSYAFSAALIATGDVLVACMAFGSPWDAAAISLIVEEAGGQATDFTGKPRKYHEWGDGILITNGYVHDDVVEIIGHADTRD